MRSAPIQLSPILFRRVSVELDAARFTDSGTPPSDAPFNFESVTIQTHVGFTPTEGATSSERSFFLTLHVVIGNEPSDNTDARFSPYLIDIEAGAEVRALPGTEALGDVEDLIVVNGTSLLWSAILEQVCTLTARMPAGLVMLPTVNFHDLKRQQREGEAPHQALAAAIAKPKTKKRGAGAGKAAVRPE